DRLAANLETFCEDAPQDDDISAVEIPLIPSLLPGWEKREPTQGSEEKAFEALQADDLNDCVELHLTLRGSQLRQADPVPILINYIQETAGLRQHRRPLFTILTELYINALDHGILQLDSGLKQGEDGFTNYFHQREQRLQSLTEGWIRIGLRIHNLDQGGYMVIQIEDSGCGFDTHRQSLDEISESQFSGRGILLVRSLCKKLQYTPPGNRAEAIYAWTEDEPE
ncbi:MAG: ATP-binding protein, partial [Candidatus Thiodiazotropha sp.]